MQKCKQCEWEFPDDIHICPYCGHPVDPEDQKQKRRFNLRWHPGTLPRVMKRPDLAASQTTPNTFSRKHLQVVIFTSTLIVALLLTGILWAHAILIPPSHPVPPSHPNQPLIVNPSLLDFGQVKTGSKSILSVIVKKSSESRLKWQIVPTNAQWLEIAVRPKVSQSSNLREDIYDVTANTGKLNVGKYSALLLISSERGSRQQVTVKIQVISNGTPLPAKLNVNPLLLDYGSLNVGNQEPLLLTVSNSGGQELRWTADKGNTSWLTLDQNSGKIAAGAIPQSINVKVDTTNLTAGQHSATINFTSNGGNASASVTLIVVSKPTPAKVPTVTGISPKCESTAGGTSVTITGTRFTGATSISFGSIAATSFTVDSDTQITVTSPAGNGTVDVIVTTPSGTSATSPADLFTYSSTPSVTSISPSSGPDAGGTSVTLTGTGFTCATSVSFEAVDAGFTMATSFTVNSDTQITAVSPAGSGTVDVTVTTPSGTSATSADDQFTYFPLPTVTGISPTSGSTDGGTRVTITGKGFTNSTSVSFGSVASTNFTVDSDTQITAFSPVSSDGIVDVIVTAPGGTSATSNADQFTYSTPPPIK